MDFNDHNITFFTVKIHIYLPVLTLEEANPQFSRFVKKVNSIKLLNMVRDLPYKILYLSLCFCGLSSYFVHILI